ncbi:anaerobic ribonucleoside-triphosphate reductase [Escherichia coli]
MDQSGKKKRVMVSVSDTARRVKTCATASAVSISTGVVPGVTDKGYDTNSFHLDVEKKVNPHQKSHFEAPYPPLSERWFHLLRRVSKHSTQPEGAGRCLGLQLSACTCITAPIHRSMSATQPAGFTGEFQCTSKGFTCPKCGNHDASRGRVTCRVCGYLGSPDARPFNAGKQEEVKRRVKHWNGQIG